jgi:hypothetical protein
MLERGKHASPSSPLLQAKRFIIELVIAYMLNHHAKVQMDHHTGDMILGDPLDT